MDEAISLGKSRQETAGSRASFRMAGLQLHPFTMVPSSNGVKDSTKYLTVRLDVCVLITNCGQATLWRLRAQTRSAQRDPLKGGPVARGAAGDLANPRSQLVRLRVSTGGAAEPRPRVRRMMGARPGCLVAGASWRSCTSRVRSWS
jgi:hypothetical protein